MKELYLLDTNTVAYMVNRRSQAARSTLQQRIAQSEIAISTISEAEVLYGIAKKPEAARMRSSVESLFSVLKILPWDSDAARAYGKLRAQLSATGKTLSLMDMLIAAHALSTGAILVTRDKAFLQVDALRPTENWATDLPPDMNRP